MPPLFQRFYLIVVHLLTNILPERYPMKWVTTPQCLQPAVVVMQPVHLELHNSALSLARTEAALFSLHSNINLSVHIHSAFMAAGCSWRGAPSTSASAKL